jgi:hypothetical protein
MFGAADIAIILLTTGDHAMMQSTASPPSGALRGLRQGLLGIRGYPVNFAGPITRPLNTNSAGFA